MYEIMELSLFALWLKKAALPWLQLSLGRNPGLPLGLATVQNGTKLVKMITKMTSVAKGKSEISNNWLMIST
jgi:hypothetical protein